MYVIDFNCLRPSRPPSSHPSPTGSPRLNKSGPTSMSSFPVWPQSYLPEQEKEFSPARETPSSYTTKENGIPSIVIAHSPSGRAWAS